MFEIGQTVMFGSDGVCTIKEKTWMEMGGESREYYVLSPFHDQKSTIYVPVNNSELTAKMRCVITAEKIDELINEAATKKAEWISDDSERKAFCDDVLNSGDRMALMMLIEMLYNHKEKQKSNKRRFQIADENCLKRAEKMLNDEFSYVLGIGRDEVPAYIVSRIADIRG